MLVLSPSLLRRRYGLAPNQLVRVAIDGTWSLLAPIGASSRRPGTGAEGPSDETAPGPPVGADAPAALGLSIGPENGRQAPARQEPTRPLVPIHHVGSPSGPITLGIPSEIAFRATETRWNEEQ